jgi:hypothetical protein
MVETGQLKRAPIKPGNGWRTQFSIRTLLSNWSLRINTSESCVQSTHTLLRLSPHCLTIIHNPRSPIKVGNVYLLPSYIPSFLLPFVPSTLLCSEARNISLLMIRAGWAHVYEDKNACYSGWGIEVFREAERAAK